jgi:hypothetical protein
LEITMRIFVFLAMLCLPHFALAQLKPVFVFVKIPESILPIARGEKYEDPLDAQLKSAKLGEVTGGGSALSKERKVEWVGVDVNLVNLESGIPFLKRKLIELGAPKGSTLEYQAQGQKIQVFVHDTDK